MNIKLELQFDGTDYHGWQIQSGVSTIQGELRRAIKAVTGEVAMPVGCGRTDAGVHAMSYIASYKTENRIPADRIPYALNAHLPPGIICRGAEIMPDSFNAARSAKGKTYRYIIDNNEFPDVMMSRFAWHYRYPLDAALMADAAKAFLGTHDFIGFAASGFSVKTTVRTIHSLIVKREGNMIITDITGNGFLYNMVRIIIGTLADVGGGKTAADAVAETILSGDRSRAGITAPANGLCLKEVFY